jgi:phospholipase C
VTPTVEQCSSHHRDDALRIEGLPAFVEMTSLGKGDEMQRQVSGVFLTIAATCYVVSPYTRRGAVVSTQYNQTSLLRTMELILGLPPMNQMDATATPMHDCFTETPDFTPFVAVTNNVPLDQLNPDPKKVTDPLLRHDALASASLPLERIDACPEDVLNRILWHAMKGPSAPYPAWAVRVVEDDD